MAKKISLNPWEQLSQKYPDLAKTIDDYIDKLFTISSLDEKTKQLVYIGIQVALNYSLAVKYHVPLALDAGATAEEVIGAGLIALSAAGPKGMVSCYPVIIEEIEKYHKIHSKDFLSTKKKRKN